MTSNVPIRIGTRKSALALWQANWCADQLRSHGIDVELVHLVTTGDVTSGPLTSAGGEGLFTKRIQAALHDDEADIAVHSLKDLPTATTDGLVLAAVPPREAPYDAFVCNRFSSLEELPEHAVIGTGSIRRQAQLLHRWPHLKVADIRGNVETRLAKLDAGDYDAIILAEAGLVRLGMGDRITCRIEFEQMLPAVGQAALGLESRAGDERAIEIARRLDHPETHAAVIAERTLLRSLRAGCLSPVGAHAQVSNDQIQLKAVVLSANGTERMTSEGSAAVDQADDLGEQVAQQLKDQGADRLLDRS